MLAIERKKFILEFLNDKKVVLVSNLACHFNVTEETIRRDLKEMESDGLLIRTHGGAISINSEGETPLKIRETINPEGKDYIGRKAANLVNSGETIILDASTSSLFVARHLKQKENVTVITNAENIIHELSDHPGINIISTGGKLRQKSMSYSGTSAIKSLSDYNAHKLFLSCQGFSPAKGLTDSSESESEIRKAMIKRSESVIFLCDKTKFNQLGYIVTASLDDIDFIVTDTELPEGWFEIISRKNIAII